MSKRFMIEVGVASVLIMIAATATGAAVVMHQMNKNFKTETVDVVAQAPENSTSQTPENTAPQTTENTTTNTTTVSPQTQQTSTPQIQVITVPVPVSTPEPEPIIVPVPSSRSTSSIILEQVVNELEQAELDEDKLEGIYDMSTQFGMNQYTADLYSIWDEEINRLWGHLKNVMDESSMDSLVQEERDWISYKENEMEAAASEMAGGSAETMMRYGRGAQLTKERVYTLYDKLVSYLTN